MSALLVRLSGYLASIAVRGGLGYAQDAIELQSRVEVASTNADAHAASTLAAGIEGARTSDALRDLSAGGTVTVGPVRLLGELHVLEAADRDRGWAGYAGLSTPVGRYDLALEAGAVSWQGDLRHQLVLRASWPHMTDHLDATAKVIVTGAHLSAGGALSIQASRRLDVALEALAGTRSRALLSDGQSLEALSSTQHELVRARATFAVGGGTLFAGASVRRDTSENERNVIVAAALCGTSFAF